MYDINTFYVALILFITLVTHGIFVYVYIC